MIPRENKFKNMDLENSEIKIHVLKRDGCKERLFAAKVEKRIENLCYGLNRSFVDTTQICQKVIFGVYDGVCRTEIDDLAAEMAASMTTKHPDFSILAARIAISKLHKETKASFSEVIHDLFNHLNPITLDREPIINEETHDLVVAHAHRLDDAIDYGRDYGYNFFGFKTLERSYLLKMNGRVVERPQQMLMRVSVGIHKDDIDSVIETYNLMSEKYFTHASATLYNAGTIHPQLSSCFMLTLKNESVPAVFETLKNFAMISEGGSGVALSISKIRAAAPNSSKGIVPILRIFNNVSRCVDQGGYKATGILPMRPGAFAMFLEPWHADIMDFLALKKSTGPEEARARDLFYSLWIPDLFMKRVEADEIWSLMCPSNCPGLDECWGESFENLYTKYENESRYQSQIKARTIWKEIISSQIETGMPFMFYKDSCNRKSNQQNLGTIKCSNLCTEVIEYTSAEEIAVCESGSIALPRFVKDDGSFDYERLHKITKIVIANLNKLIDVTWYPVSQAKSTNLRHRPLGLGVQGLADVFQMMRLPFTSEVAKDINKLIFETMYHAALECSCELAQKVGTYESYEGSPISKGILQFDMWNVQPSHLWNWEELRQKIAKYGVRNSLLISPLPTATTAQILGNNESIEPYTSNIYSRRVLSGDFQVVNPHLLKDLVKLNLWNDKLKNKLIAEGGSIQNIPEIPDDLKQLYKTVWEIRQRDIIDMAVDRAPYVDQSQSLNIFLASPSYAKCTSMHFYGWKKGLKTGMYYLRSRPAVDAVQFTVDKEALNSKENN